METNQVKEIIDIMWKDLKEDINELRQDYKELNGKIENIKDDTSNVKTELSNLKIKSSIWGAVTGSLSSLGLGGLNHLIK